MNGAAEAQGPSGSGGPLSRVLKAISGGAASLAEISTHAGLPRDSVEAAVEQLVRMGRLEATRLTAGCPDGGCGACASGHDASGTGAAGHDLAGSEVGATMGARAGTSACGPGCGADAPSPARSGPVLIGLRLRSVR